MKKNLDSHIMPTYGERSIEFTHGKGVYLYSKEKKYLDFGSGIAVTSLGHCNPILVKAINKQAKLLWHTSNLYFNKAQENYASLLCKYSFADKVFFTNSGSESIECGIKIIRSYFHHHKINNKKNIITFQGSFHGRTFAALSAQKKHTIGFKPLLPGFKQIPFNDVKSLKKNVNETTAAILIETIQGEGGVNPVALSFLEKIKNICINKKILLFLDEVQSGFGRSGKLFSYEWSNIEPDIMAVAKGIGSGFPMGACLANNKSVVGMTKGKHGSTFGGNNLAIAVGTEVIKEITSPGFLKKVDEVARYLWKKLKNLEDQFDEIVEIRGAGLLIGIKTRKSNLIINELLYKNGLLTLTAADNVIRLAPSLIISFKEVDKALKIITKVFGEIND